MILSIFVFYLFFFGFFVNFLRGKIAEFEDMPVEFAMQGNQELTRWLFFGISGIGFLVALAFLIFFLWWVVDIWGLQVWINRVEIRVQNTITGPYFKRWTGIGKMKMEDIVEVRGGKSATHVSSTGERIRFSPVDRVDVLISEILKNSKATVI